MAAANSSKSGVSAVMREVDTVHLRHRNNSVPHFLGSQGSWDTFPIHVQQGQGRFQPKYKKAVVKFQVIISHIGSIAFVSGPHPGAMSDTTLARIYRPVLRPRDQLLADLAYMSVPKCLRPFKKPPGGLLDPDALEFNRVHQFYRAKVEHQIGQLVRWRVVSARFRSPHLRNLKDAVRILCGIHNMRVAFRCPYVPYTPVPQQ